MKHQEVLEYLSKPLRTFTVNYPAEKSFTLTVRDNCSQKELLEKIFEQFNHGSGKECDFFLGNHMRSLSVHDFVKVDGQWFQCASIGWNPVTREYVDRIEGAVIDSPSFTARGARAALQELMWLTRKK